MKYINKILNLFVIALIATSCDPDAESYTLGELEDGDVRMFLEIKGVTLEEDGVARFQKR